MQSSHASSNCSLLKRLRLNPPEQPLQFIIEGSNDSIHVEWQETCTVGKKSNKVLRVTSRERRERCLEGEKSYIPHEAKATNNVLGYICKYCIACSTQY